MSDVLHVMPVGDLIVHKPEETCLCGPQLRPVVRCDGSCGWLLAHPSLDGREKRERET